MGSLPSDVAILEAQRIGSELIEVHKSLCDWKHHHEMGATLPWFPDIMTANIHNHALSFEIICLMEMQKIDQFMADHESTFTSAGIIYTDQKAWELAGKICQSAEYFLQEEMKLFGPASAIFPLCIVYGVLRRDCEGNQENIRRCQGLMDRIRQRGISTTPHFSDKLAQFEYFS